MGGLTFPKIFVLSWMFMNLLLAPLSLAVDEPVDSNLIISDSSTSQMGWGKVSPISSQPIPPNHVPVSKLSFDFHNLLVLPLILVILSVAIILGKQVRSLSKFGYITLLLFMALAFVSVLPSVSADACTDGGGISCSDGSCVQYLDTLPNEYGSAICTVNSNQDVRVPQDVYFALDQLTVNSGSTLRFISSTEKDFGFSGTGATYGGGGTGEGEAPDGGRGGAGGTAGNRGSSGAAGHGNSHGSAGIRSSYVGAEVSVFVKTLVIEGTLSVAGPRGGHGGNSGLCSESDLFGCVQGAAGGGAGGGSGGGFLHVFSLDISGNGIIDASGGDGGHGGGSSSEDENMCECDDITDHGGDGGGGGGGAPGRLTISTDHSTVSLLCKGGLGKYNGCYYWRSSCYSSGGIWGYWGTDEPPQDTSGEGANCLLESSSYSETECSDGYDNDFDSLIDMEDPDCFNITGGLCPSTNYGPYLGPISGGETFPSWFQRSAGDGYDACCGDDPSSCAPKYATCSEIPMSECADYAGCSVTRQPACLDNPNTPDPTCYELGGGLNPNGCPTNAESLGCTDYYFGLCTWPPPIPPQVSCNPDTMTGNCYDPCYDCVGTPDCTNINTQSECNYWVASDVCNWDPGECGGTLQPIECSSQPPLPCDDGCERASTVPFTTDYGSILPADNTPELTNRSFMCYQQDDLSSWSWLGASTAGGQIGVIIRLDDSESVDVVANGENWYSCDASGQGLTNGIHVGDLQTFPMPTSSPNGGGACPFPAPMTPLSECDAGYGVGVCNSDCAQAMYNETDGQVQGCCWADFWTESPLDCVKDETARNWCWYSESGGPGVTYSWPPGGDPTGTGNIKKSDFPWYGSLSDPNVECEILTDGIGVLCDSVEDLCIGGITVLSSEYPDELCCLGSCALRTSLDPELACEGEPNNGVLCPFGEICLNPIPYNGTYDDGRCCAHESLCVVNSSYNFLGGGLFNDTYICNNNYGDDTWAECCFGSGCTNVKDWGELWYGRSGRVFITGGPLHSIATYDRRGFPPDDETWMIDWIFKDSRTNTLFQVPRNDAYTFAGIGMGDWTEFDTLEFDYAWFSDIGAGDYLSSFWLVDTNNQMSPIMDLSDYSTSGVQSVKPHHVIVNLSAISFARDNIARIKFNYTGAVTLYLDNIRLVNSTAVNAERFCSGEFHEWLPDLEPADPTTIDPTDIISYGKWKLACDAQLPFGWTGRQCCGDDNGPGLSGDREYYEDAHAGCWEGVQVPNNFRVSDVLYRGGVGKNILFYDENFTACLDQVVVNSTNMNHPVVPFEPITIEGNDVCTTYSKWFCSPQGEWDAHDAGEVYSGNRTNFKSYAGNLVDNGGFSLGDDDEQPGWDYTGTVTFEDDFALILGGTLSQMVSVLPGFISVSFAYKTDEADAMFKSIGLDEASEWTQYNHTDSTTGNNYSLQFTGANISIDNVSLQLLPEPAIPVNYGYFESCCSPETCWDGDICVQSFDNETYGFGDAEDPAYGVGSLVEPPKRQARFVGDSTLGVGSPPESYICSRWENPDDTNASWHKVYQRWDPDGYNYGYCIDLTYCWFDPPSDIGRCVPDGFSGLGYYCDSGAWVSNLRYVILAMLNYANQSTVTDYSLHCEEGPNVLPDVPYFSSQYMSSGDIVASCLMTAVTNTGNQTLYGAVINNEENLQLFVDNVFNLSQCDVSTASNSNEFEKVCPFGDYSNWVWIDKPISSVIYSHGGVDLVESNAWDDLMSFLTDPIQTIVDWLRSLFAPTRGAAPPIAYQYIEELKVVDSVYTSETYDNRTWFGNREADDDIYNVEYTVYDNICNTVWKKYPFVFGSAPLFCRSIIDSETNYSTFVSPTEFNVPEWRKLGPGLRWHDVNSSNRSVIIQADLLNHTGASSRDITVGTNVSMNVTFLNMRNISRGAHICVDYSTIDNDDECYYEVGFSIPKGFYEITLPEMCVALAGQQNALVTITEQGTGELIASDYIGYYASGTGSCPLPPS